LAVIIISLSLTIQAEPNFPARIVQNNTETIISITIPSPARQLSPAPAPVVM